MHGFFFFGLHVKFSHGTTNSCPLHTYSMNEVMSGIYDYLKLIIFFFL